MLRYLLIVEHFYESMLNFQHVKPLISSATYYSTPFFISIVHFGTSFVFAFGDNEREHEASMHVNRDTKLKHKVSYMTK